MLDASQHATSLQSTGPSSLGTSKPFHSETTHTAKPSMLKALGKMGFRMWLGLVVLVLLTVGGAAAAYLSTTKQDLRQQAAPAYFGVGGDCGGFTQRNNQPYCSDTVSGSCLTCKDGKGASAPDSACVGLPCGTDVRLTQAAGSKCSGDVAQGTVACSDSGQVEGNCKKCMYDAARGYATYQDVPASECFSQSLVCGIKPTVAPTARPTVRPTVGPTLKPNCYIVAGKEVCYGTTPVPTAVLTKTPTTVPTNPFAGVTAGVGGVSPTSPVTTSLICPVDGGSNGCQGDTLVQ